MIYTVGGYPGIWPNISLSNTGVRFTTNGIVEQIIYTTRFMFNALKHIELIFIWKKSQFSTPGNNVLICNVC